MSKEGGNFLTCVVTKYCGWLVGWLPKVSSHIQYGQFLSLSRQFVGGVNTK